MLSENKQENEGGRGKLLTLRSVFLLALLCCALFLYYFFFSVEGFPALAHGSYTGTLRWPEDKKEVHFYVEHSDGEKKTLFLVFDNSWKPQFVPALSISDEKSRPLRLKSPEGVLSLRGERLGESFEYVGTIEANSKLHSGQWALHGLSETSLDFDFEGLKHWLLLVSEMKEVEEKLEYAQSSLISYQERIKQMESLIDDREELVRSTEEKLRKATTDFLQVKKTYEETLDDAKELARQFRIARRVTPMGKLVSLARETFERESRWIQSMLRTDIGGSSKGALEEEIEKGQYIISLKHDIAREKALIFQLKNGKDVNKNGQVLTEPGSLDEIWRRQGTM